MSVERVQMPKRHDGKRVPDRWLCDAGHLHPGRAKAVLCNKKRRALAVIPGAMGATEDAT